MVQWRLLADLTCLGAVEWLTARVATRRYYQYIESIKNEVSITDQREHCGDFEHRLTEDVPFRQLTICFEKAYQNCSCDTHRLQALGQRQASRLRYALRRAADNRSTERERVLQAPAVEQMESRAALRGQRLVQDRRTTATGTAGVTLGPELLEELQVELRRLVAIQRQSRGTLTVGRASLEARHGSPQSPGKARSPLSRLSLPSTGRRDPGRSDAQQVILDTEGLTRQAAMNQASAETFPFGQAGRGRPFGTNVSWSSSEAQLIRSPAPGSQSAVRQRQRGSEHPGTSQAGSATRRSPPRQRPARHGSTQQEPAFEDWDNFSTSGI